MCVCEGGPARGPGEPWGVRGSAGLLQGINHLLQDVGAVVGYLLEDRVGVLLQLSALLLTHLQLPFQLQGEWGGLEGLSGFSKRLG